MIAVANTISGDTASTRSLNISAVGTGSVVSLGGAVGTVNLTTVCVTASAIALNGATVTSSGNQTYAGAVTLGAGTTLTASNVTTTSGSTIAGAANTLNVSGNAYVGGDVSAVSTLNVSGTTRLNANVSTTGNQTYSGAMTVAANTSLAASDANSTITLASTLDGDTAATKTLNITSNTTSGKVVLGGVVGTVNLSALNVTAKDIAMNATAVTTSGNQTLSLIHI